MANNNPHRAHVDAFIRRAAAGSSSERLVRSFEAAAFALWRRAHRTLGDITLTAIFDRVLYNAAEQHPLLASLEVGASGLDCEELREQSSGLDPDELAEGIRFLLEEFLSVLGNLTAEILTPALHAELERAGHADAGPSDYQAPGATRRDGEDTKP